mmetsp:Transcript_43088/g.63159  ORF Transcript_43088/g.63159 Transcript_43088/m.63159 type:complete len:117 (-) Transcript_43088:120-470(-)
MGMDILLSINDMRKNWSGQKEYRKDCGGALKLSDEKNIQSFKQRCESQCSCQQQNGAQSEIFLFVTNHIGLSSTCIFTQITYTVNQVDKRPKHQTTISYAMTVQEPTQRRFLSIGK